MFSRVLIVCVGNICRSPMAVAMLRERCTAPGVHIDSCGLQACVGYGIEPTAQEVLDDFQVTGYEHRASQVTLQQLHWADLVLVMEHNHLRSVIKLAPEIRGKVALIGHWRDDMEIGDPFRRPKGAFVDTYNSLSRCVEDWLPHLGALASQRSAHA
ncbi:low molecular weight protein-tyrosine-phosphatase [Pseudomonas sp. HR96]|uniref:low molecular weight protein-tyrosine-phosphatase n=1 Tax=Pseudomonas sp. HR96 TaxID=1027966 RepID=UPI002A763A67|nr:low molecular weight protein-tyrosine-phosphatase [Pseudomonas sp. HR96]WPP00344.1 low molecular weight protein-tyrosine-phosphatase [Pseudomonas sp. HR96]